MKYVKQLVAVVAVLMSVSLCNASENFENKKTLKDKKILHPESLCRASILALGPTIGVLGKLVKNELKGQDKNGSMKITSKQIKRLARSGIKVHALCAAFFYIPLCFYYQFNVFKKID